jgi:hypothetical protein
MRFPEIPFSGIVTRDAQWRLRLDEQVRFGGAVGAVTDPAPLLLEDRVDYLLLISVFLMARIACLRAFRLQKVAPRGAVGVVAGRALPGFQDRVYLRLVQPDFFPAVAGVAQFVPVLFQQELGDDPVPEMTVLAFSILHAGVQILEGKIFLGKLLVAVEASFPLELSWLRPGGFVGSEEGRCREAKNQSNEYQGLLVVDGRHTLSRIDGGNVIWPGG